MCAPATNEIFERQGYGLSSTENDVRVLSEHNSAAAARGCKNVLPGHGYGLPGGRLQDKSELSPQQLELSGATYNHLSLQ